jgi:hypothetical protein
MKKRDRTRPRLATLTTKEIARRDRQREAANKWRGMPPGMPAAMAQKFKNLVDGGKTIKDLTDHQLKSYLVPGSRFQKHCELNPMWSDSVRSISDTNASRKKRLGSVRSLATRELCLKGLHPMKGHNLMVDKLGLRRCRECFRARSHGKPMTSETMDRIKDALERGESLGRILWGKPTGGGPIDRSLVITTSNKFYHQCKIDPAFASFVDRHIADSNTVGQTLRHGRGLPAELKPTLIAVARLKHKIKAIRAA